MRPDVCIMTDDQSPHVTRDSARLSDDELAGLIEGSKTWESIAFRSVRAALTEPSERRAAGANHFHCAAGCEKAQAETVNGHLVCARCGADFVPCTQETCG